MCRLDGRLPTPDVVRHSGSWAIASSRESVCGSEDDLRRAPTTGTVARRPGGAPDAVCSSCSAANCFGREPIGDPHQRRPQAAMDERHLPVDQSQPHDIRRIVERLEHVEDVMATGWPHQLPLIGSPATSSATLGIGPRADWSSMPCSTSAAMTIHPDIMPYDPAMAADVLAATLVAPGSFELPPLPVSRRPRARSGVAEDAGVGHLRHRQAHVPRRDTAVRRHGPCFVDAVPDHPGPRERRRSSTAIGDGRRNGFDGTAGVGDRVVPAPNRACGECEFCRGDFPYYFCRRWRTTATR